MRQRRRQPRRHTTNDGNGRVPEHANNQTVNCEKGFTDRLATVLLHPGMITIWCQTFGDRWLFDSRAWLGLARRGRGKMMNGGAR